MLTDQDIEKLVSVLATKKDVQDLKEDLDGLKETVQGFAVSIDGLAKHTDDLHIEYKAMGDQLDRHETALKHIATKLDMNLQLE